MASELTPAEQALRDAALEYHRSPTRGKIAVLPTKPLSNQRDLSLAYSPGVAYACLAIEQDPTLAAEYTSRANLVGVITNGTAVLGLGDIGPLAGKPVMEGKGCLFKKFAGIDVFDIELAERDPDKLVEIIAALEPTLGGINLEDIKAPECFHIERALRERLHIPVFHDDQHGTAIISSAALLNALELVGKPIDQVRLVASGAGAAAIACLDLMVGLGVVIGHITVVDSKGVIRAGRADVAAGKLDESKQRYCQKTEALTLADAVKGADVFLGCSAAGVLTPEMVATMAAQPIILALANPEPEIRPELAKAARPDCIVATGRSDYPNQVNNVLCFPYIFRGALDCGATRINEAMKLACVREIAALAKAETPSEVAAAYAGQELRFGPDYIIPKPFDARLILRIAPAVAQAAAESGVATRPIADLDAYRQQLGRFVYQTGMVMRPVFAAAKAAHARQPVRVVYAEGEDERVLRAVQVVLDEGLARPILIGRPAVMAMRIERAGLRLKAGVDFDVCDPEDDPRFRSYWALYHQLMGRDGVSQEAAKAAVRRSNTLIACLMLRRGEAEAMLCGLVGQYDAHLAHVCKVIGRAPGVGTLAAMNALMLEEHTLFITDTFVNETPDAAALAEIARLAANEVRRFGMPPKVAFVSHSMYGSSQRESARRMRAARDLFVQWCPDVECDGELQGDAALSEPIRESFLADATLKGAANLLVLPNLDAANILFNVLKVTSGHGVTIGPMLLGAAAPVHVLTPSATMRRVVNMTALAVADATAPKETAR
ncbi:NADP-dependent malic enzyme [Aquabacterium sp. OR-4]|uniref:NADP-dependent malic enzyme n=1 Tax=Aquabacterium sp. OR-4 TaxID=2978127 RepID=UPI0028C7666A|nr:NADP-dependent malic enzyme [Aquabacterium sp. OR-4]MDT7837443.1 NADP-dependent malic enzyme [Aquabacterium sp. OR-4]